MRRIILASLTATLAIASPLQPRQDSTQNATSTATSSSSSTSWSSAQPSVTIYPDTSNGQGITVTGSSRLGIDNYYGIPFAAPPVGDLRFTPPQSPQWNTSSFNATTPPPACIQASSATYTKTYGTSEDCLYLNVQTPQGANAQSVFLPVVVWVYGGSFTAGTSTFYDGSLFLTRAAQTSHPVIYVSFNYRLGILGFPQGSEVSSAGAANLGLKDVQKALEWVQENIWAWGGDPSRVTVFGESAGAILISLLYLQQDMALFRGAIMQSGAQSTAPIGPTGETWQGPYDALVQFAGCSNSTSSNSGNYSSSLDCLKSLPTETLLNAQEQVKNISIYQLAFVFGPSIDGDLIPDSPHALLAEGAFAKIPYISGNMRDEGTGFLPSTPALYTNETLSALAFATIEPITPSQSILQELFVQIYPDDPSLGSPFGTGNETFGLPAGYKQLAAILGDAAFQANRRWFLNQSSSQGLDQTWSYTFNSAPPSSPPRLGAYHSADVPYTFGLPILAELNLTIPQAALASSYNFTQADAALSAQVIDYWVNFAYYLDPNGDSSAQASNSSYYWPSYTLNGGKNLFTFERGGNGTITPDTYREEQIQWFLDRPTQFNYKRTIAE